MLNKSSQELPGGLPQTTFRGKINHFLPNPGQELQEASQRLLLKVKLAISCQILARSFKEASQKPFLEIKLAISCQILARSLSSRRPPRDHF